MTSYWRLQTNVLPKFVDTTCIFRDAGAAVGKESRRHGGGVWGINSLKPSSKTHQTELWSTINRWSFHHISECQTPLNRRKAPLLTTFWRRFCREGRVIKQLRAMETYKTSRCQLCLFLFINSVDLKNNNRNDRKNHSEFSGCRNSYNKFISSASW